MAFVSDNFSDTANVLLSAHTGAVGATWTKHGSYLGDVVVSNANRIRHRSDAGSAGPGLYYASGSPVSADYGVEAQVLAQSDGGGAWIAGRIDTAANSFYYVQINPVADTVTLNKIVAGAATPLGTFSTTITIGTNFTMRLEMVGSKIRCLVNSVERISVTDADITAAGKAGVGFSGSGALSAFGDTINCHLDTFRAYDAVVLAGTVAGIGSQSGDLVVQRPLGGQADGVGSSTGAILVPRALEGASTGQGSPSADLIVSHMLEGTSTGSGATSSELSVSLALGGQSDGQGTTDAIITVARQLAGQSDGVGNTTGDLTRVLGLYGASNGSSTVEGDLRLVLSLVGQSDGIGSATGSLSLPRWQIDPQPRWSPGTEDSWAMSTANRWPVDVEERW